MALLNIHVEGSGFDDGAVLHLNEDAITSG